MPWTPRLSAGLLTNSCTAAEGVRMTESELQSAVIELAELTGWLVFHSANVKCQLRSHTAVGFPDLTAWCMSGQAR